MNTRYISLCSIVALTVSACAQAPDSIEPSYVPALAYVDHSCSQIEAEAARAMERKQEVMERQQTLATRDALVAGAVVATQFYPAAMLLSGGGANAAELSNLKGQINAIEAARSQNGCRSQSR